MWLINITTYYLSAIRHKVGVFCKYFCCTRAGLCAINPISSTSKATFHPSEEAGFVLSSRHCKAHPRCLKITQQNQNQYNFSNKSSPAEKLELDFHFKSRAQMWHNIYHSVHNSHLCPHVFCCYLPLLGHPHLPLLLNPHPGSSHLFYFSHHL